MSTRVHIVVPDGVLRRVDDVRGDVSRSRWILRAMESALEPPAVVMVGRDRVPAPPVEEIEARLDAVSPTPSTGKGKSSRPVAPAEFVLPKIAPRR